MNFLHDTWYVVALATEVDTQTLLPRKVLDQGLLIYRKGDGTPVVLRDRCPHRFAPLSMGRRVDDDVVCGYHALRFDCSGKCVHSIHGDGRIPKAAVVRSYPSIERHGFIWAWMGEAQAADPALIPDCGLMDEGHANSKGYARLHMKANYEIVVDNIMDLSHVDVVHGPLLNSGGKVSPLTPDVREQDGRVRVRWEWQQDPPMAFFAPFLPDPQAEVELMFDLTWDAPATMLLTVGAVQGSKRHEDGLLSCNYHIMTPETATTTHYFYATRRNWLVEDENLNNMILEGTVAAFKTEDEPIIEAVQREMGTPDLWSLKPVLLTGDAGAVRVRRKLAGLIAQEQQPAPATAIAA